MNVAHFTLRKNNLASQRVFCTLGSSEFTSRLVLEKVRCAGVNKPDIKSVLPNVLNALLVAANLFRVLFWES